MVREDADVHSGDLCDLFLEYSMTQRPSVAFDFSISFHFGQQFYCRFLPKSAFSKQAHSIGMDAIVPQVMSCWSFHSRNKMQSNNVAFILTQKTKNEPRCSLPMSQFFG